MGQSQRTDTLEHSVVGQDWADVGEGAQVGRYGNIQIMEDGTTFSDLILPDANDARVQYAFAFGSIPPHGRIPGRDARRHQCAPA